MNDFLQLVNARQSDRAYDKSRLVEADKLERILEAGRLAPSACNAQPWRFVVVTDPSLAEKVGKAAAGLGMNKFAKDAPVHILVVEESANITSRLGGKLKGKHFPLIDIGIVAAHMVLAAESEGLGSCILGWFDEKEIKSLTGIPSSKRVLLDISGKKAGKLFLITAINDLSDTEWALRVGDIKKTHIALIGNGIYFTTDYTDFHGLYHPVLGGRNY